MDARLLLQRVLIVGVLFALAAIIGFAGVGSWEVIFLAVLAAILAAGAMLGAGVVAYFTREDVRARAVRIVARSFVLTIAGVVIVFVVAGGMEFADRVTKARAARWVDRLEARCASGELERTAAAIAAEVATHRRWTPREVEVSVGKPITARFGDEPGNRWCYSPESGWVKVS
jgi:hypothetical protein